MNANESKTATENWQRYEYGRMRGHRNYIKTARYNEGMYLGGGMQWTAEDAQALAEAGRPAFEFNQILPKINAALGYQIANRMDISYRPRGGQADEEMASTLSKLTMQIADNTQLHWKESQVFADGLIQQRGYFEVRVSYDDTLLGEVKISTLDPLDVIPDPDAKSYDPDDWSDVIVTKWMTIDEIEMLYGTAKRAEVIQAKPDDSDFGEDMHDEARNKFGDNNTGYNNRMMGFLTDQDGHRRIRVIDRQYWTMEVAEVLISLTGDIRVVEGMSEARIRAMEAAGAIRQKRRVRRIRWVVTTQYVVLHDDFSPFQHFTVVPYFPFFRRGVTRGLVDNAVGPQQMLNKSMSQMLHIINTTSNSGWITWANTLANMSEDEVEDRGADTGLHMVLKKDTPTDKIPRKIQPNQVPTGLDRIIERSAVLLEQATGINAAMVGAAGPEVSGIAIQSRQHAAQQMLAVPLDNLARTRNILARRILDLIQGFYDQPRIVRITESDGRGRETTSELALNQPGPGGILNDLTIGEYDVVIAEVPLQVTFENSQFLQAIELIDKGAPIPWPFVLRYSNLANKQEIIDALEQQGQPPADPLVEAKVALTQAQTQKTLAEGVNKAVESQYSAMQAAGVIAATPATSPLADALLKSAGYVDRDAGPIVPEYQPGAPAAPMAPSAPTNTHPLTPANPAVGLDRGIETPAIETA